MTKSTTRNPTAGTADCEGNGSGVPVDDLVGKAAAGEVVTRFAWSFDRSDWVGLRTLLADEVHVDYSGVSGAAPEVVPAALQIERWQEFVRSLASWQHLTSTPLVEVTEDEAVARVNVVAWLRRDGVAGPSLASSGGTWTFGLTRGAEGAWRIGSMTARASWFDGDQAAVG